MPTKKTEFRNNPTFASVLVGSKASGGGANAGGQSGGATGTSKSETTNMLAGKVPGFSDLPVN